MYVEDHDGKVENDNYLKVFNEKFNLKFHKNKKDNATSVRGLKTPLLNFEQNIKLKNMTAIWTKGQMPGITRN